jgi:hypothetical protein
MKRTNHGYLLASKAMVQIARKLCDILVDDKSAMAK